MGDGKNFVELFPGFRDYCYYKCDGQIPYHFAKLFNYQATIFTYHRDDYKALNIDIPNFQIKIIEEKKIFGKNISQFLFLLRNASKIDVLYYYQIGSIQRNDFIITLLYKCLNPKGILFIRFEADLAYVNKAYPYDSFNLKGQSFLMKLLYKWYFSNIDIFGILDFADLKSISDFPFLEKLAYKKIKQQLNGFNLKHILGAVAEIRNFDKKENIIVISGRLGDPLKGVNIFFDALQKVDLKDWKVLLMGSDDQYLKDLIADFIKKRPDLKEKIISLGFINERDKYFLVLNRSKIYVLPSRLDGMPHVIPEAMALGNVVIGSKHHGVRVALEDGKIGRLFDVGDSLELCKILNELIGNELILKELSEASYKKAHSEFEWGIIIQNVFKENTILKQL